MSAGSLQDQLPQAADAARPPPLAAVRATPNGSAPTTIAALCKEFGVVCRAAVDPLEIASALEFEGIGDRAARTRFGAPDVFALAQQMYSQVERSPAEPEPPPDPWPASTLRPALHGILYALPAVCYPAAGSLLAGPGALSTLVLALLVAWGLSQGLASLGYQRLGTAGAGPARRVLRAGLAAGLAAAGLAMAAVALVLHTHVPVLMFGMGEAAYMLGASVAMVLGTERWLLAVLAPAVLGSAAFLLLDRPPRLEPLTWGLLAATPAMALVLAAVSTRRAGPSADPLLIPPELRAALPALAFGLISAGLLIFPVVTGPAGHGGINPGALVAAVPLSLSMGAAEWSMLWYRRRTRRVLHTVTEPRQFTPRARRALLAAALEYLAGVVTLTAAAVAISVKTGLVDLDRALIVQVAAYLTLGTALFLALLLQSLRARTVPLIAGAAVLATEIALRGLGLTVQIAGATVLLAVIAAYAAVTLGEAVRHAY
jgi:hypothetical protein